MSVFFFSFGGATPGGAQDLLLALNPRIIPEGSGSHMECWDEIQIGLLYAMDMPYLLSYLSTPNTFYALTGNIVTSMKLLSLLIPSSLWW